MIKLTKKDFHKARKALQKAHVPPPYKAIQAPYDQTPQQQS